jgi:hypothetical protein
VLPVTVGIRDGVWCSWCPSQLERALACIIYVCAYRLRTGGAALGHAEDVKVRQAVQPGRGVAPAGVFVPRVERLRQEREHLQRCPGGAFARFVPRALVHLCQILPLPISRYRFKFQSNLVLDSIKSISNLCFQF